MHNLYGHSSAMATWRALTSIYPERRPFLLTRCGWRPLYTQLSIVVSAKARQACFISLIHTVCIQYGFMRGTGVYFNLQLSSSYMVPAHQTGQLSWGLAHMVHTGRATQKAAGMI